ncbi:hypothetical protein Acr_00g0032450 [Actinidia rufa]|uniref:Transmembrane protein n=1 Tax=Actinidia rufa TaxID=165716 RepID=A0A7J0DHB7_9ERIC|nr:hypothetical protein Acr_00g0032450 [Actinidia rufa]
MASSRASRSRIFYEVDLSRVLTWSSLRGLLPLLDRVGVLLDSEELFSRKEELGAWRLPRPTGSALMFLERFPERFEWRDRSTSGTSGAAGSGGLAAARSCIRRPLFSFIILICSAISCISRWRPSRSGAWAGLAIGWDLFLGGLLALGLGRLRLRRFLGTRPRIIKGRPAQTNRNKGPGRGRSKPLRRGDQTKTMTVDGVMGRVRGSRRDPRKDEYGKISRRCRRHNWKDCHLERRGGDSTLALGELTSTPMVALASSVEIAWRDSVLIVRLVLPRSRGFGDRVWRSKCDGTS